MDLISSLFLGFVQGITEFLPISSSGHIELFLKLLNLNSSSVTFDVVVHIFKKNEREYYGIERLWADAPIMELRDATN
mgnify:CR=1 FL=1